MWVWPPGLGTERVGAEGIRHYQDPGQIPVALAPCSEQLLKIWPQRYKSGFSSSSSVRVAVVRRPPVLVPRVVQPLLDPILRQELIGNAPWVSSRKIVGQVPPGASSRSHVIAELAGEKRLLL
eukprot:3941999-Rhodomonas_salina.1